MLNHRTSRSVPTCFVNSPAKQRGVVLLITLIVLVAMTLAAIALMRSVDTTNVIAGNLAFRQSASLDGDTGTEAAIAWLEQHNTSALFTASVADGYSPNHQDPNPGQTWDQWWTAVALGRGVKTLATDSATGNTVSYAIERMCTLAGDPITPGTNCAQTTVTVSTGCSQTAGTQCLQTSTQIYYRITSRTAGPRNTVSYIQAVIAL